MKIQDMMQIALMTAVIGMLGLIPPILLTFTPVPITLQTAGLLLAGGLLKPKQALISLCLFLLVVAAGAPLLSGGRGGIGVFFGPSGGFLLAYPVAAFMISLWVNRLKKVTALRLFVIYAVCSIVILYMCGIPFQAMMMHMKVSQAAFLSLIYLPGDLIKAGMCAVFTVKIIQAMSYRKRDLHKGRRAV
ncbi:MULTISPECIES: biotin transporter BioY [Bacillus]|uniref:biotin transporter BioY n=1 Tax=Bacillus TaxID=1386 RepID=UPI000462AED5|nr:biotin transporter BioY [Bacillus safensis]MCY1091541.1 biotin transporter BioY [Bacillus safensis]MED0801145.1 biotin transporter BioY [Bacillus safensis]PGC65721.1 biotin transporter BioY [Bacillus safensis]RKE71739.1 biotin transport system substrate-specific component [Bacillus safensis]GLF87567.1 putative biotin transporter BioY [Bacillus safensis]